MSPPEPFSEMWEVGSKVRGMVSSLFLQGKTDRVSQAHRRDQTLEVFLSRFGNSK